jgi:UDP-glucose 4-epimerase
MDSQPDSRSPSPGHSPSSSVSEIDTPLSTIYDSFEDLQISNREYIAVVGGLGYIGSHTCLELLKSGYNVVIIDNLSNSFRSVYTRIETLAKNHFERRCESMPQMRLYESDYRDEVAMRQILEEYVGPSTTPHLPDDQPWVTSKIRGEILCQQRCRLD